MNRKIEWFAGPQYQSSPQKKGEFTNIIDDAQRFDLLSFGMRFRPINKRYLFFADYSVSSFQFTFGGLYRICLLYTSPSPRDATLSRMPSSA